MKIAIVGSGISGLGCAHLLKEDHEITLFEASHKPGGHVNTVDVAGRTGDYRVDTGFIVFNEHNYPNFVRLLELLGVESQPTRMGFSVRSEKTGIEYSGESILGLFGGLRNLTDPKHWSMVRDILRFHKLAEREESGTLTVGEFLARHKLGDRFTEAFLLPLGSALWSCSADRFSTFPMEFLTDFLANHKMLQAYNRPVWRVLKGGSRTYVDQIVKGLGDRIKLNTPIQSVRRTENGVALSLPDSSVQNFDQVILACHADQSLKLLDGAEREEIDLLEKFPYEKNQVTLHSDDRLLPRRRSARASWNAYLTNEKKDHAVVTYDMNILQSLPTLEPFCVSLNQGSSVDPARRHGEYSFEHPTYHPGRKSAQGMHASFIQRRGISLCGAYWGYGFHEDGLSSALRVCQSFGKELE
jgi:predicted NAD/FAD-binding protein